MKQKLREADFGYDPSKDDSPLYSATQNGSVAYARACVVRTLRESEVTLRRRGKLDLANGYSQLADAVERGYVNDAHGFEYSALYLGLHSYDTVGVQS